MRRKATYLYRIEVEILPPWLHPGCVLVSTPETQEQLVPERSQKDGRYGARIRLRDRVDRIWQRALAQQCRPRAFVSSVSLRKVDIVGERYRVDAVGLDDCEFGHDAGRTINIRNVYVSL